MSTNLEHQLNLIIEAVFSCSRYIQRDFNEIIQLQNSPRGVNDFANKCYAKVEGRLIAYLNEKRPKYDVISANGKIPQNSDYFFVIEPIGGIENFKHSVPFCCVAVALFKNDNKDALAIVVHNPILRETFYAADGLGSWFENHAETSTPKSRMRVSNQNKIENAYNLNMNNLLLELSYLAAGRFDFVKSDHECNLITKSIFKMIYEAGGIVDFKHNGFAATNSNLAKQI